MTIDTTESPSWAIGSPRWQLAGAGAALVVAQAALPALPPGADAKVATVAAHTGAVTVSAGAFLVAGVLLILSLMSLSTTPLPRGRRLAMVGAVLTAVGAMWPVGGRAAFNLVMVAISGADRTSAAAAVHAIDSSGAFAVLLVSLAAFVLGPIVLTLGLWRAGAAPVWPAVLWFVGVLVVNGAESSSRLVATLGMVLVAAALAWLGAAYPPKAWVAVTPPSTASSAPVM